MAKQMIITLLDKDFDTRESVRNEIESKLSEMEADGRIEINTGEKLYYTIADDDVCADVYVRISSAGDKLIGAFLTWFAYETSNVEKKEDGTYCLFSGCFDQCFRKISHLCTMVHRIKGIREHEPGFDGRIDVKICNFRKSGSREIIDDLVEPAQRHVKYFNKFHEFDPFDFRL